ncbi:hypothetical protein [Rivularia sp. PCC 7116]|uniref:hypothetical protein n=1 Tax=Rivularia sp. PCC 7116 TaxID=373994 RepID=UPI0005C7DA44|nr:hypothetical protein [Rivularia sp. PCC 7116]
MKDYEHLRKKYLHHKFRQPKNKIYPLQQKFRQHNNINTPEDKPYSTIKPFLVSMVLICTWSFTILFLAKVSYKLLQEIYLYSAQEVYLHRE